MKVAATLLLVALLAGSVSAREPLRPHPAGLSTNESEPNYERVNHNVGRLSLNLSNWGVLYGAEFPRGSFKSYLSRAGLLVGGILNGDTLVSSSVTGWSREFTPAEGNAGQIVYRSTIDPNRPWFEGAVSHQDYIAVFTDTCVDCPNMYWDEVDDYVHKPLNIEVTRTSYAWAFDYTEDFVLMDYAIKNIGNTRLRYVYIGFFVDGDVATTLPVSGDAGPDDDMVGFVESFPATYLPESCPPDSDLINIGWTADDDGNITRPQEFVRVMDVNGLTIVRAPHDSLKVSFNWWSQGGTRDRMHDYGPQRRSTYRELPFELMGTPYGDRARYHFLSNGERDYDQCFQYGRPSFDAEWVQPTPPMQDSLEEAMDPCYLLSFGPFGLEPQQTLPLTVAYVGGDRFHRDRNIYKYLPDNPEIWYDNVFFDQLALNAKWAQWIYDNPGVDTDSDGYAGEYLLCNAAFDSVWKCDTLVDSSTVPISNYEECYWEYSVPDTVWRSGDGVPDFRAAYPPPSPSTDWIENASGDSIPSLRVYPEVGRIRLVWNGAATETALDPFSRRSDFEGYNVYLALDDRPTSFSIVTSYDRPNYNLWVYSYAEHRFRIPSAPYTLEQLRCMFADSCHDETWHPLQYTRDNPLIIPGGPKNEAGVYYFEESGPNRSIFANDPVNATTQIRKVYPDAPRPPHLDPDSLARYFPDRDDSTYFTEDGYLKYFEYEYTFENLLPTVPYYVNVTAFDYGYPELGLPGLESDAAFLPKAVYALPASDLIEQQNLEAFVYPNPYRLDADYRERGFEANQKWHVPEDKTRLIHFANLPPKCTISIFSIDGDLISEIKHDVDPLDYLANHETWNLINRNQQLIVSGLYYWTVEDELGNVQIGKLVVIM